MGRTMQKFSTGRSRETLAKVVDALKDGETTLQAMAAKIGMQAGHIATYVNYLVEQQQAHCAVRSGYHNGLITSNIWAPGPAPSGSDETDLMPPRMLNSTHWTPHHVRDPLVAALFGHPTRA